ncbi:MAG: nucleotidyl transferase AbiEii/AbiGii toxin family protein [bacterium]
MLHFETVDANTLELLRQIQRDPIFSDTRLVGGTALALQLGHRKSIDLDFFGTLRLEPLELEQTLRAYGPVSLTSRSRMIQVYAVRGVKVDLVEYPYPWLDDPMTGDGVRLASYRDIAAMKLSAITNRGSKKDFIDLAFLLDQFSLNELLAFYQRKYAEASRFLVMKSLTYFDDAEDDPMPQLLKPCDWDDAKRRIVRSVTATQRNA